MKKQIVLVHHTCSKSLKSIREYGLLRGMKPEFIHEDAMREKYEHLIMKNKPLEGIPAKNALRYFPHNELFFMVEGQEWLFDFPGSDAIINVNLNDIDESKAYTGSLLLGSAIFTGINDGKDETTLNKLARFYWNDFFSIRFYLQNYKMIQSEYFIQYGYRYVPEVVYFGDIPPEYITVQL